ncbi:protein Shroom isoform X5 [Aphis gossypii]|uniref:protein Shroom isoform X5 n=1 Tax=Aphis gossypii TaxID=80765 RepID=UPI002158D8B8|nr:protein Shroom isoform X5 [Aphis gossypii]
MFSSRTRSSVRLKDPKQREDSNVGGGGGAGAFTRWLREFRRETYKVNSAGGASGGGGGTYHSTAAEDGRRRHSFNAHDKSAQHRADQRLQLQGGGGGLHSSPASKTQPCRRANSTIVPKSRTRNDGLFAKANCSAVATIRELPSSKENRSSHGNNGVVKSGRVTTRMTETCDGHIPRHRSSLPPVEVKDVVCGHEKFPSCPAITDAATTVKSNGMSVTATRKSWAEEQQTCSNGISSSNSYPKEQPPPIVRPYPKRLSNGLYTQQVNTRVHKIPPVILKTVMERCEKGKPELLDRVRSMRTKNGGSGYVERLHQTAEKHFCVPLSSTALDSVDPKSQLTQAQLEKYSRAYDDSPHRETDEYSSCFDGSDSALSSHLTKEELDHYTRIYEEKSTSQMSLTEKTAPSHQHQTSYAQSEGYHSYVSSTDSTSTPFLDRLRRDSESAVVVVNSKDSEKPASAAAATQGRDSSASSGSSSETLKWHGSNSDLSTVSSSGHRATTQLIAHSAKVSAPQRHHSESVLSVTDGWSGVNAQEHRVGNQRNLRKLFPVSTYTVQPAMVVDEKTSPKSPPALTVAERINELEKQQQQQQQQIQQTPNKFTYFDPEKKHRVADHSLRAIQKRALLSFYERHQPGSSWRSEPQLSPPPPRPPPIPCRPRLPTPLSRRSSISSEYDTPATWNDDCSKDDSSVEEASTANTKELNKNNPLRSSSCGSLSTAMLGPMVLGPSISIDDWVPELPPKKKQVARQQTPQAKREPSPDLPPPPPVVDDDEQMFVSDEPLPPPPPEAIWPKPESLRNDKFLRNGKEKRLESSFSAVEDVLLSRDFNAGCGGVSAGLFPNNNYHLNGHQYQHQHNAMSEKSKSLSYIYDSHKAVPQTPVKSFAIELLQPPQLPPPPTPLLTSATTTDDKPLQFPHNNVKEFGRSSSVRRNKLTIPNKDYCKSEFSARKSVFQGAGGSAVPKQQVVMSTVKPPAFSATITTVQSNVVKHQICTPLKIARDMDKKAAAAIARSPSAAKNVAVVGPLKSSGVFPPSLEPSCPPTLYQQSQSKASYLSAYKREPREREKGLPNFEGSYKRTASPNSGGRGDAAAAVEPQDVENVAPDGSDCCNNLLDSGGGRLQSLQLDHHHHLHHFNNNNNNNNNTATSQQQQSSPGKQQQAIDAMATAVTPPSPPPPTVLSERPVVDQPAQQQQQQLSKTLPRANNSVGQDFKRSSRTPRTQSDPSNMPNKADSAITTLQLMMMPPPRHSESASSLQKRSQSDLSQVGSTESGYSSLSLNAPSPSHSPTRLSSGDFVSAAPPLLIHSPSAAATAVATACDLDECCTPSTWHTAEPAVAVTATDHRYRNPVSRSCSAVSSDAASQTDVKSVAGGTPSVVRRKSPEEIECEELSRDLISHLSPSDKLHNILAPGPDVKRSTDYVSPLFRMDLMPRSRNSVAEKLIDCSNIDATSTNTSTNSTSSSTTAAGLSANSSYYTTSEPKAKLLNLQHYSRQIQSPSECNGIGNLQKKKADLVSRLDRKLKVLRDEQIALAEETTLNEALGVSVADRVKSVAKPQEANKFKTHVQEVGHITSLLLSLSGRLARAENALLDLDADHPEKKALEEKKCKLTDQLEEAKELKENIDRRGDFVSTILSRYLTADEYSDYDHFIAMKAKLLIDAREIADKIQLGEEQLRALKETLED